MKYRLDNPNDVKQAKEYLDRLIERKNLIELKKISPKRSLRQNAYIHLTFGIFAVETGFTIQEAKDIFKKQANPDIFVYTKRGIQFLRSTADLTVDETTKAIDRWREYAAQHDILIPLPEDTDALLYWQNQIEMQGNYL